MRTSETTKKGTRRRAGKPGFLRFDLGDLINLSDVPEKRRHLYVAAILLALILLAHVLKTCC